MLNEQKVKNSFNLVVKKYKKQEERIKLLEQAVRSFANKTGYTFRKKMDYPGDTPPVITGIECIKRRCHKQEIEENKLPPLPKEEPQELSENEAMRLSELNGMLGE